MALTYLDSQRLTQGTVLNGGDVILNAQIGSRGNEAGSSINVGGVAPVRLDILNQAGGLGQWVGSDAGSLSIRRAKAYCWTADGCASGWRIESRRCIRSGAGQ